MAPPVTSRFERWIQNHALAPRDLAVYRVLYATYILLLIVPVAPWLSLAPAAFFRPPPGLAAMFTAVWPAGTLLALNLLLALFVSCLLVGWRTRLASIGTGLTLLVLNSWAYSPGKINHDIVLVLIPLVLAFSGWGQAFSIDTARGRDGVAAEPWPMALLALLVGFAMFTAGWAKVTTGWLDPDVWATYGHLVLNYRFTGRETWAATWALSVESQAFWKSGDWAAVALEAGFLMVVVSRRAFCFTMALATFLHLGVLLLFDIAFSENLIAYAAFVRYTDVPLPPFLTRVKSIPPSSLRIAFLVFGAALTLGLVATLRGRSTTSALHLPLDALVVWAGAAAGGWYFVWLSRGGGRRSSPGH